MSVLSVRNVLPLATAIVSALFLATAVPHDLPETAVVAFASPALAQAEVQRCVDDGREADACLDDVDGKALIERAESLASGDAASRRAGR